jgi:hypothetical protein
MVNRTLTPVLPSSPWQLLSASPASRSPWVLLRAMAISPETLALQNSVTSAAIIDASLGGEWQRFWPQNGDRLGISRIFCD